QSEMSRSPHHYPGLDQLARRRCVACAAALPRRREARPITSACALRESGEDQHMSRSDIDQPAGRAEAGRAAGGAEPTKEERAAAAAVLQMILGIHISRAVSVVAALGVADLLAGGPMTAAQ